MLIVSAASSTSLEVVCISEIALNTTNNFWTPVQSDTSQSVHNSERNVICFPKKKQQEIVPISVCLYVVCSMQQDF